MNSLPETSRCLASIALFGQLYTQNKDVLSIISEFLKEVIVSQKKYSFNLSEITIELNQCFDFSLPEAVVKTALGKLEFLQKNGFNYTIKSMPKVADESLTNKREEIIASNKAIFDALRSFIEKKESRALSIGEWEKYTQSFSAFILNEPNGIIGPELFSSFLVEHQSLDEFQRKLDLIKEGVLIYSGLRYDQNLSEVGSWNSELTIFLDVEILFHFVGYNGDLFKTLFFDFFNLVIEINKKSPNRIKLFYFPEIKREIEDFFSTAENIVRGLAVAEPNNTAMATIVNGCSEASQIAIKKSQFFRQLEISNIREDLYENYYDNQNHTFNIDDLVLRSKLKEKYPDIEPDRHLKYLNYVGIRRGNYDQTSLSSAKYVFLTGNSRTLRFAWDSELKKTNAVPLATDLDFLTSKFWFKLNKGFGKNSLPKSFQIMTKAQVVLAFKVNSSIGKKFDNLKLEITEGRLTEDEAKAAVTHLRKEAIRPEDVNEETLPQIITFLTQDSLSNYIREQENIKNQARLLEAENDALRDSLIQNENVIENLKSEKSQNVEKLQTVLSQVLKEKKERLSSLEKLEKISQNKAEKDYSKLKFFLILLLIIGIFIFGLIFVKIKWETLEPISCFAGILFSIIFIIFGIIKGKDFSITLFLDNKKAEYLNNARNDLGFSFEEYTRLLKDINDTEKAK